MDYLTDITDIAHDCDIGIRETEFESVDGMCLNGYKGYLIIVDSRLSPYHRRWMIAHEMGHIADDTVSSCHTRIAEYRADCIALDTLIPEDSLRRARLEFGEDCEYLPQIFGVSTEDFIRRCKTLL